MILDGEWECLPSETHQPGDLPESGWRPIVVPSNWHLAGLPDHEGTLWYRKRFAVDEALLAKAAKLLCFEGVDYLADVWLNGTLIGRHEGYFAPFHLDATSALRRGESELCVRVSSPREESGKAWPYRKQLIKGIFNHHDCRPGAWHPRHGQSANTGGIWGSVTLVGHARPYVRDVHVSVHQHGARAKVIARMTLAALPMAHAPLELQVVCRGPGGEEVACVKSSHVVGPDTGELSVGFTIAEPRLWWSWDHGEQPMYTLEIALGDERAEQRFAVRTVERRGEVFYLNERRIFLRGSNVIPAQWLSAYGAAQATEDVRLAREAGLNMLRVHAHVNRRELYEACDAAGMLVWQDFALQWSYDDGPELAREATRQAREMVRLLRRHPSIVVWCCHNEPVGQERTLDPLLVEAVLAEDGSRIVRSHSDFREHPYPGWYYGHVHEFAALPGAPLVTEFGAQALPSVETMREMIPPADLWPPNWAAWAFHDFQFEQTFHVAGVDAKGTLEAFVVASQTYQARLLRYAIDAYRRARFAPIVGILQFMFVDGWPSITWSVLDHHRRPKLGYETLREVCSPVYLSVRPETPIATAGRALPLSVVLINDLHESFDGAEIAFSLNDAEGVVLQSWPSRACSIGPDELADLGHVWKRALDTSASWSGDAVLVGVCSHRGRELSRVHVPLRLEPLPPGLEEYKPVEMI
jgi:beta-mannosidase